MIFAPFYFKQKAKAALKGNWQTALLVAFFSRILITASDVFSSLKLPNPYVALYEKPEIYLSQLLSISRSTWLMMAALSLLAVLLTPVMQIGCKRYFLLRLSGEQPALADGLFGRMRIWHKALWLYVVMGVRIFLWSLLLVVPGILAALRYSMAPYYLAENPDLSVGEAIQKSKQAMQNMKTSYFMLVISFIGWNLLANVLQLLLMDINGVAALVAAQFAQLWISTYMTAAVAAFYRMVSSPEGMDDAKDAMRRQLRQAGMSDSQIDQALGRKPGDDDSQPPKEE